MAIVPQALTFDVFGSTMVVERWGDDWLLLLVGVDGKRCPADMVIPNFIREEELAQYLDDIYHEAASPNRPCVTRVLPSNS